jgi:hypothetical protein
MSPSSSMQDRELERQGRRMIGPAIRFVAIAAVMAVAGIAVLLLASVPGVVGSGWFTGGAVARWAARHRLFA